MKIAICTVGSTGDMQPYLALALSLQQAGHAVRVISHPFHQTRFESKGLDFRPCGPVVTQQELNDLLDRMLAMRNPITQLRLLMTDAFFADGESYFHAAKAALVGCDVALIHMVDFLSGEAAAQLGIPRMGGILAPTGIPTAYAVPPPLPNLGKWLNPWAWKLVRLSLSPVDRIAHQFLRRLGGPSITVQMFHTLSPQLNLIACSPTLAPTYPDLPTNLEVMGPWILEEPAYTPEPALAAFLQKHPRPVMVSFGSMGGTRGPALAQVVLQALRLAGLPAVIQSGYSALSADEVPDNVCFVDFVPHDWLFPQAACVVHHAGAGTTTAVARAGVPHVPVTFLADQPYFADQLHRLGIAPKSIWHHQLRPQNLASKLLEACTATMQARAKSLQATFLSETGNAKTVARIEQFVRDLQP